MNSREGLTVSDHDKDKLISDYRKRFAEYGYSPRTLGYKFGDFPITENYANTILSIPMYNGYTEEEQDYVIKALNSF